jgi:tetrapyrrole methylase family protein / MazG family protein
MSDFEEFRKLIRTLRGENGCPWDKKQTLQTLALYILEESQEVAEAVESKTDTDVCEELGDVMLIVLMMAQVAEEQGRFNFDDCVKAISEKIIRRHPHVFGEKQDLTEREIVDNWQKIKEREKQGGTGK